MTTQALLWVGVVFAAGLVTLLTLGPKRVSRWLRNRRMTDPVAGTLLVTACSGPSGRSLYTNYHLYGVVTAPGLPATPVEHLGAARNTKWPFPGTSLPVLVDRRDPSRLRIRWDRVPTGAQAAARHAQRVAEVLREQAEAGLPADPPGHGDAERIATTVRESLRTMGMSGPAVEFSGFVGGRPGEAATAVVTASRDVPVPFGEATPAGGAVELTLEVTRADGSTYPARAGVLFSSAERRMRFGTVGVRLPVRIDPADPYRVAIDTAALGLPDPL